MNVYLYNYSGPKNKINKAGMFTLVYALDNATFIEPTDLENPALLVSVNPMGCNYCSIDYGTGLPQIYYFIVDRIADTNSQFIIKLQKDYLYTYNGIITSANAYVTRSTVSSTSDGYNDNLVDGAFPIPVDFTETSYAFDPNAFHEYGGFGTRVEESNLGIMQAKLTTPAGTEVIHDETNLLCILSPSFEMFSDIMNTSLGIISNGTNLATFMYDVVKYPFTVPMNSVNPIPQGHIIDFPGKQWSATHHDATQYTITNSTSRLLKKTSIEHNFKWEINVPDAWNRYKNHDPYCKVFLQFEPYGRVELNTHDIFKDVSRCNNSSQKGNSKVYVEAQTKTNMMTGDSLLYVNDKLIGKANLAIKQPICTENYNYDSLVGAGLQLIGSMCGTAALAAYGSHVITGGTDIVKENKYMITPRGTSHPTLSVSHTTNWSNASASASTGIGLGMGLGTNIVGSATNLAVSAGSAFTSPNTQVIGSFTMPFVNKFPVIYVLTRDNGQDDPTIGIGFPFEKWKLVGTFPSGTWFQANQINLNLSSPASTKVLTTIDVQNIQMLFQEGVIL